MNKRETEIAHQNLSGLEFNEKSLLMKRCAVRPRHCLKR